MTFKFPISEKSYHIRDPKVSGFRWCNHCFAPIVRHYQAYCYAVAVAVDCGGYNKHRYTCENAGKDWHEDIVANRGEYVFSREHLSDGTTPCEVSGPHFKVSGIAGTVRSVHYVLQNCCYGIWGCYQYEYGDITVEEIDTESNMEFAVEYHIEVDTRYGVQPRMLSELEEHTLDEWQAIWSKEKI